ncbi:MAG: ribokinase [Candidatus Hydrogenedentes bacterium]|nr:ribokinase [Candidatus Hydrogenedentota bacterium]
MSSIVVIGSSNTDMILRLSRIPAPGETVLGGSFATAAGGKGANQAVAVARLGGKAVFVARVGGDIFGEQAIARFRDEGINAGQMHIGKDAASGVAFIFVDDNGENCIGVAPGANAQLCPADIDAASEAIFGADAVVIQLEIPIATVEYAAARAHAAGVPVILNPAPAQPLSAELLRYVSVITPNESEAELLTGISICDEASAALAAEKLHAAGVPVVIITLGARGAFCSNADTRLSRILPGFKVNAVDVTAAGDVFNGAIAVALAEGQDLESAIVYGNAAAAMAVTLPGAQPSIPYRADVLRFLEEHAVTLNGAWLIPGSPHPAPVQ